MSRLEPTPRVGTMGHAQEVVRAPVATAVAPHRSRIVCAAARWHGRPRYAANTGTPHGGAYMPHSNPRCDAMGSGVARAIESGPNNSSVDEGASTRTAASNIVALVSASGGTDGDAAGAPGVSTRSSATSQATAALPSDATGPVPDGVAGAATATTAPAPAPAAARPALVDARGGGRVGIASFLHAAAPLTAPAAAGKPTTRIEQASQDDARRFRRHWHSAARRRRRQRHPTRTTPAASSTMATTQQQEDAEVAPATCVPTAAAALPVRPPSARSPEHVLRELAAEQEAQAQAAEAEMRPVYPFCAIIGQEEMKLSLVLNVVDPRIGGVMVMGDRGTGKTTAVRAIADLLPRMQAVAGDPFNSHPSDPELMGPEALSAWRRGESLPAVGRPTPLVDLPLGATEDRVCGTIDIERALSEGVRALEPGLLARANRGILYVDEVNLLDDHLVDVLLDAAASGWNVVERESISIRHPARFILVGSGNPEEGELRPQLLDRFGMHAFIKTVKEPELRVQIVNERQAFDTDAEAFRERFAARQQALADRIVAARTALTRVQVDTETKLKISMVCSNLDVDGIRGDIVTTRAARALAALEQRQTVTDADVGRVIVMGLRHRLRKDPLANIDSGERVRDEFERVFGVEAAPISIG